MMRGKRSWEDSREKGDCLLNRSEARRGGRGEKFLFKKEGSLKNICIGGNGKRGRGGNDNS